MDLKDLIPKDKFDNETAVLLFNYTFEEVEPIIPQLLKWLQDGNWPVSRPVGAYLNSLESSKITPYLLEILNGSDQEWKYFVINILGSKDKNKMDPKFLNEIERIAYHPTEIEKNAEVDDIARMMLNCTKN